MVQEKYFTIEEEIGMLDPSATTTFKKSIFSFLHPYFFDNMNIQKNCVCSHCQQECAKVVFLMIPSNPHSSKISHID